MIVGTAGHVDHGKTALVRSLTGIDTDRLPEEKRRGISLELGFAEIQLPNGCKAAVIDVPGHERFIKTMAAGACGVDVLLLVVAADEGVRQQTREHVDICSLLGVQRGVLAISKADLLPRLGGGWLDSLQAQLCTLTSGTFLDGAPLVLVSAKTGEGIDLLKAEIARQIDTLSKLKASWKRLDGPLFLPIDRAFTVQGFGLVLTGTLLSGRLTVSDAVSLLPGQPGPWRIRGLQVHSHTVQSVNAGDRVAVNLPQLALANVYRGMTLIRHNELPESKHLDVELTLLSSADVSLPRQCRRLIALGTTQLEVAVQQHAVEMLRPGETCFARLRLPKPVAALPGQCFILRGTQIANNRTATIGGGRVLALRRRSANTGHLQVLAHGTLENRIVHLLTEAGFRGLTWTELLVRVPDGAQALSHALESAERRGLVLKGIHRFLAQEVFKRLQAHTETRLERFHEKAPHQAGLPQETLQQDLKIEDQKLFQKLLASLIHSTCISVDAGSVSLTTHRQALCKRSESLKDEVARLLAAATLAPPLPEALAHTLRVDGTSLMLSLKLLISEGCVVRVGSLFFNASAVRMLQQRLVYFLTQHRRISIQQFKTLTGQSRKFTIPLAEYFDEKKVTRRAGGVRVLHS